MPLPAVIAAAVAMALLMSTQFLFQPFVWRGWSAGDLLAGWLHVARDRLTVALVTATTMLAVLRWARRPASGRLAPLLATGILVGATLGETLLAMIDGRMSAPLALVVRIVQWGVLAGCVATIYDLWQQSCLNRASARLARLRKLQTSIQLEQARLRALRSQIEPHFLFNTLATVRRLHRTEPSRGGQLLAHFIDYLNSALPRLGDTQSTLAREVELVRAYLGINEVRFSGRLRTQVDVPAELLNCRVPPLTLATLVENAVKHGIVPAPDGGSITVQARRLGEAIEVSVTDTGVGFTDGKGSGIGLANIRARLESQYGNAATLALRSVDPHGVQATIRLPWQMSGLP